MAEDNHLRLSCHPYLWKFYGHERRDHLNFLAGYKILEPRLIVATRQDLYVPVQLTCPFCEMAQILECEISKMVDNIILANNVIPLFHHDSIHLVDTPKWTIEILNGVFIIKMCIRSEECLHNKHKNLMYRFSVGRSIMLSQPRMAAGAVN